VEGKLITDFPHWLPQLWWEYRFFWGGWYSNRKDAMHLEFLGTTAEAKALTERAKRELHGGKDVPYPFYGEDSKRVRKAQRQLKSLGFDPGEVDGVYGDDTKKAVRDFELSRGRLKAHADGYFGPLTWKLLWKKEKAAEEAPPEPQPAAPATEPAATATEPVPAEPSETETTVSTVGAPPPPRADAGG
jgi:hypothetical protein